MKHLIALLAVALFAATPLLAQDDIITLPSGERVRIVEKDGQRVLETIEDDEEEEDIKESKVVELDEEFPIRIKEILKRVRKSMDDAEGEVEEEYEEGGVKVKIRRVGKGKWEEWSEEDAEDFHARIKERMEELRKQLEELRKEIERDFEDLDRNWEDDPDAEVEEWEEVSPDGKTIKKVKIVRIRKTSKSGDETPRKSEEKEETERKQ